MCHITKVARWPQFECEKFLIHAPVWGATVNGCLAVLDFWRFNPRARVGRDHDSVKASVRDAEVSIHAPVWGATSCASSKSSGVILFQSTRPCGARHGAEVLQTTTLFCFNPRARVGRDMS